MDVPDVRYARAGGVAIAYQVVGEGSQTLVFSPHASDLFTIWLVPHTRAFVDRLAEQARVVILNPRGTGLSDRPPHVTLEARMDDITAVLDDIGASRSCLFGVSTSANVCALYAATFPERVERLILVHPYPRGVRSDDYPWGDEEEEWLGWIRDTRERWGERAFLEEFARGVAPFLAEDPESLDLFVWQSRLALGPAAAADWMRLGMETDIVDVLSAIRIPTLVLYRPDDADRGAGPAHFVTDRIRGSSTGVLRADRSSPFSQEAAEMVLDFLSGAAAPVAVPDSVLATVLFTDLVGSTERAAELGDRAWRDVLERHHAAVRRELGRYRGVEIDAAGDGFFCRFDGPARAMACARAIVNDARELELGVRAGVHTGECELIGEKIAGIAVNVGSRIASAAAPGEVLVSRTVKDLVAGSGYVFEDRGEHDLKGVAGAWRLYAFVDG